MQYPIIFLRKEVEHFKKLPHNAQKLLISFFIYSLASPLLFLFMNAFIWRNTNNIYSVMVYNLGMFLTLPFGFLINGLLLRQNYDARKLYAFGALLMGIIASLLVFLGYFSAVWLFLFGLLYGLAIAFYWSNRNLLSLKATHSAIRNYFSNFIFSAGAFTSVIVPFVVGWIIFLGEHLNLYSALLAYKLLILFIFFLLYISGRIIVNIDFRIPKITKLVNYKSSNTWSNVRIMMLGKGIANGHTFFLPAIIILILLGQENTLGNITSISTLISAVFIYFLGKRAQIHHRLGILVSGILVFIIATLFFGIYYSLIGILVYSIFSTLSEMLTWPSINAICMDVIDNECVDRPEHNYMHICDQEIFLNIGRISGTALFFLLIILYSREVSLRFAPILLALTQLSLIWVGYQLVKAKIHK